MRYDVEHKVEGLYATTVTFAGRPTMIRVAYGDSIGSALSNLKGEAEKIVAGWREFAFNQWKKNHRESVRRVTLLAVYNVEGIGFVFCPSNRARSWFAYGTIVLLDVKKQS